MMAEQEQDLGPKINLTIEVDGRLLGPTTVKMTIRSADKEPVVDIEDWESFFDAIASIGDFTVNMLEDAAKKVGAL
jgi:hypothetical protein